MGDGKEDDQGCCGCDEDWSDGDCAGADEFTGGEVSEGDGDEKSSGLIAPG